ncbi:MAG: SCO family protein [Bacillota bacterium]|nr:SCO family protein [Bacillota bacterium]
MNTPWLRVILWSLVVVLVVFYLYLRSAAGAYDPRAYRGADLGLVAAPSFHLTNQKGEMRRLEDYRGKAILLTFLDGHCKDVCPLTLQTMADVEKILGKDRSRVAMVAISVDPLLDKVGEPALVAQKGPSPQEWDFLTGSLEALEPVWKAYGVQVDQMAVGRFTLNQAHDTGFFILDPKGRLYRYIQSDVEPILVAQLVKEALAAGETR